MERTFYRLSKFTVNAPLFTRSSKDNLSITFFLRDNAPGGNAPERYLYPQVAGGEVYVTRFSRALRRRGVIADNDYVMHWYNPKYKATPGRIQSILSSLSKSVGPVRSGAQFKRNLSQMGKYFILGGKSGSANARLAVDAPRKKDPDYQGYGIYTRTSGGQLDLVYRILREVPTVPAKYEWTEERIGAFAQEKLPDLIIGKLKTL
jgi:hypothetical protein